MVEYGDFECPFCGQAHRVVKALKKRWPPAALRLSPFPAGHGPPPRPAGGGGGGGGRAQGQFWEMHDMLFDNQEALEDDDLMGYAEALGLDLTQFAADLAGHVHAPRVRQDFLSGVRSGVNGTPTFFLNEMRYDGPRDFDTMVEAIEEAAGET